LDGPTAGLMSPQFVEGRGFLCTWSGRHYGLCDGDFATGVKFRDIFLSAAFFPKESGNKWLSPALAPWPVKFTFWIAAFPLNNSGTHKTRRRVGTTNISGEVFLRKLLVISSFFLLGLTAMTAYSYAATTKAAQVAGKKHKPTVKPYRVLVIIGDQWIDPLSYNIDSRRVKGGEFTDVVTMLKIWGVPFDVLRLDQQRLQINRFLDGEAKPKYGCMIWMADPDKLEDFSANYQTLKRAVEEFGISMIALFDDIKTKQVAALVGVEFQGAGEVQLGSDGDGFSISGKHFVTSEAVGTVLPDAKQAAPPSIVGGNGITISSSTGAEEKQTINVVRCTAGDSAKVLGTVSGNPQLTVRDITNETKVIWIGGGKDWFRKYPAMRRIFRKSLVYSIGYGVFNDNFENGFIFIMDDVGCSEHAWSLRWHYPTPSKETLLKYLIEPLQKRGLMMVQFLTPGYANPETRMIEVPWAVKPFKDIFGNWQDYGSTKAGLDEGLRRGVFEIQPHRAWSHMNWDLDSAPGPWWGSPIDGEMAVTNWYNEIVDVRRGGVSVPSNDLLFLYKSGIDAIRKAFGVVALSAEVRTGAEISPSKPGGDDNGRVAAIAGLGVSRECYVGFDWTIEFSMMMPEQFTCHDLDLTARTDNPADQTEEGWDALLKMTTEQLVSSKIAGGRRANLTDNTKWIDAHKDKHWMGFNECCAYLHSGVMNTQTSDLGIEFQYDDHYCKYFEKKSSLWTLELSDAFRETAGKAASVRIDGKKTKTALGPRQLLTIPAGLGTHKIEIY
jgi:hypothetical protein